MLLSPEGRIRVAALHLKKIEEKGREKGLKFD